MIADGITFQAILLQDGPAIGEVGIIAQSALDVEMVTPAGELETVVAKVCHFLAQVLEWDIPPLAAGDGNGMRHE
jgi:hypothetical protein